MEPDDLDTRNWGYYEPYKEQLGLRLMSSMGDQRDTKPFVTPSRDHPIVGNYNPVFLPGSNQHPHPHTHHRMVSDPHSFQMMMRQSFFNKERLHMVPNGNPNFPVFPEPPPTTHSMQILQPVELPKDPPAVTAVDNADAGEVGIGGPEKKRTGRASPKDPKPKKPRKAPSMPKENGNSSVQRPRAAKKNMDVVINGIDMDISGIPSPVCTCTGSPQQCYRWGCGGWQSACCTTLVSVYPLPMSTKRRGARIAGRKMSQGAFKKVLEKLAAEGYNFANPIDLKTHWAKHGTNKFVTIR